MFRAAALFLILQHFGYAQSILEDIPFHSEAQLGLVVELLRSGNTYDAIRHLRQAELSRSERSTSKLLALAYYLAGQQILFEERVKRLMAEQPEDFAPYYYLGRHVFSDVEDFERAAELFRQSVVRNPKHARSYAFLGAALSRLQKFDAAEQALNTALLLDPRSYFAHLEAAKLALTRQQYERALNHAAEAATLSSADPDAHKLLAKVYSLQGNDMAATLELETAARLAPEEASIFYQLHQHYRRLGQSQKAKAALERYQSLMRD